MLDTEEDVLHLVHPKPVKWNDIMLTLSKSLKLPLVSYDRWLGSLEEKAYGIGSDPEHVEKAFKDIPALRLINFFRSAKG